MLYFCFLLVPYWEFYFTKFFCLLWKKHLWQLFCHLCGCGAFFERFPDPHKSVSDHIWPAVFVAIADSVLVKELWTLVRVIHHRIHQEIYFFLFTMLDTTSTPSRSRTLFGSSVTKILTDVIRVWSTGWHLTQYGSFSSEEKPSQHPLLCTVLCKSNESEIRRITLLFSTFQRNSKNFRTQRFVDEIFAKYHGFYCSYPERIIILRYEKSFCL